MFLARTLFYQPLLPNSNNNSVGGLTDTDESRSSSLGTTGVTSLDPQASSAFHSFGPPPETTVHICLDKKMAVIFEASATEMNLVQLLFNWKKEQNDNWKKTHTQLEHPPLLPQRIYPRELASKGIRVIWLDKHNGGLTKKLLEELFLDQHIEKAPKPSPESANIDMTFPLPLNQKMVLPGQKTVYEFIQSLLQESNKAPFYSPFDPQTISHTLAGRTFSLEQIIEIADELFPSGNPYEQSRIYRIMLQLFITKGRSISEIENHLQKTPPTTIRSNYTEKAHNSWPHFPFDNLHL